MDEFDEALKAIAKARSDNRNSVLSRDAGRIAEAKQVYLAALEAYGKVYHTHIERVRVAKWMASYEASRRRGDPAP